METKTLNLFCQISIVTFLNPVHTVPLNQATFKLIGMTTQNMTENFTFSQKMITISLKV